MNKIRMEDIDNLHFWVNYFGCSYPNAYDEEEDVSVSDLMQEICTEESRRWWDALTGYYDGFDCSETELNYFGIAICGAKKKVNKLTLLLRRHTLFHSVIGRIFWGRQRSVRKNRTYDCSFPGFVV